MQLLWEIINYQKIKERKREKLFEGIAQALGVKVEEIISDDGN